MQGDPRVLAALNEYLSYELTGHRQYLVHAAMCRHWGFERMARIQDGYSAEETQHAARIIARILLLGGAVAPREFGPIAGGEDLAQQLERDHALVAAAVAHLRSAIGDCEQCRDFASRDLLAEMLDDEERHLHWLDTERALLDKLGAENYLQSQLG
ncbi:MAG TPA: bacterioferritin [Rubrivivax sp.]|nr:bacterioferritin [Burkholderiales bacterium]HNU10038.1 bacterioferritin [Rubrivivax sp.]